MLSSLTPLTHPSSRLRTTEHDKVLYNIDSPETGVQKAKDLQALIKQFEEEERSTQYNFNNNISNKSIIIEQLEGEDGDFKSKNKQVNSQKFDKKPEF